MTLVNLVLESLADGIFSERRFYVCVSQVNLGKKQWKWHRGDSSLHQNKTLVRAQVECPRHAETTNHADRKSSINYKQKIIQISP